MGGFMNFEVMASQILRSAALKSSLLRRAGLFFAASELDKLAAEVTSEIAYVGGSRNLNDLLARCQSLGGKPSGAPLSASYTPAELRKYMLAGKQAG